MTTLTKKQAALDYAEIRGWPVFPCLPNSKAPATEDGFKSATVDLAQIEAWWDENPDFNIGFVPASAGLVVLDLDIYKSGGVDLDLPPSYTVQTPRQGFHKYYETAEVFTNHTRWLNVDVRGGNGYVCLPPSTTPEGMYRVLHDRALAPLPYPIAAQLHTAAADFHKRSILTWDEGSDEPKRIAQAEAKLRSPGYWKEGGYNIGCMLRRDAGLKGDTAARLWQEWQTAPDYCGFDIWESGDIRRNLGNAAVYGKGSVQDIVLPPPKVSGAAVFSAVAGMAPGPVLGPLTVAEMRERAKGEKDATYLWQGRLLQNEPNLWTGDAGIGKTTLVENVAVAVAAGCGLLGKTTRPVPVLLFVAEDRYREILQNLDAIAAARGLVLDDLSIKVFSSHSEEIEHNMAVITDDGDVYRTPFYDTVIVPALEANKGALVVFDPIAEWVDFNHNADKAARACARKLFVPMVYEFGITPLGTDHPSKNSMATGEHYGGSKEMKAAFASVGTMRWTDPKNKDGDRQELTFEILRTRYGPPSVTEFYRLGKDPAFKLALSHDQIDAMVLSFVTEQFTKGLPVDKKGVFFGPELVAGALGISTPDVVKALQRLTRTNQLTLYSAGSAGNNTMAYKPPVKEANHASGSSTSRS